MADLSFVPSDDMIKELQKRFDEMVLMAATKRTTRVEDLTFAFTGSYHACIGLIELGKIAAQAGGATDDEEYSS